MKIPQVKLIFDRKKVATRKKVGLVQVEGTSKQGRQGSRAYQAMELFRGTRRYGR